MRTAGRACAAAPLGSAVARHKLLVALKHWPGLGNYMHSWPCSLPVPLLPRCSVWWRVLPLPSGHARRANLIWPAGQPVGVWQWQRRRCWRHTLDLEHGWRACCGRGGRKGIVGGGRRGGRGGRGRGTGRARSIHVLWPASLARPARCARVAQQILHPRTHGAMNTVRMPAAAFANIKAVAPPMAAMQASRRRRQSGCGVRPRRC